MQQQSGCDNLTNGNRFCCTEPALTTSVLVTTNFHSTEVIRQEAAMQLAAGSLPVANLDVMEPPVHPIHKVLHTRHVQHKVRQVPAYPHI